MKKLFIIDGHALIFKMYYAFLRRPMVNSKGVDTSILYGFTKYLLEIVAKEQPSHIAVAFDPPAKTFRHEIYPDYKANRPAAPELVKEALDPLTEIVEAMGIPMVAMPGYEADDVIGTLAKKFEKEGFDVYMVTPDKDFGQLVSDNIFQYKPGKSGEGKEILGKKEICEYYGIERPEQVIDILTLWGDASDNVPGVRGIGEKGARKMVAEFGSVENIYAHLDGLSQKQKDAFKEAEHHIGLSKYLVTINTSVPIEVTEEQVKNKVSGNAKIWELFDRYEFPSLKKFLPIEATVADENVSETMKQHGLELDFKDISFVAETVRKNMFCSVMVDRDIYIASGNGDMCARCSFDDMVVRDILQDKKISKACYGAKECIKTLANHEITLEGDLYDIEIMHYVLNPERSHKLDLLCRGYLDISLDKVNTETDGNTVQIQPDLFSDTVQTTSPDNDKTARDCVAVAMLHPILLKELENQNVLDLYKRIEMPLISVLARMEMNGVKLNTAALAEYGDSLRKEMSRIEVEIRDMAGDPSLNISSAKQVGIVLYERMNLNPGVKKNGKDNYPTDEETLNTLKDKHPIVGKILEFRAYKKLLSTYIDPLPLLINSATGKIHTTYTQALTATGRLSSVRPNLQNIPIRTELGREIRKSFVPSDSNGFIVSADYSQIELRIMAHLSNDTSMIADFLHGDDIHTATAAKIFKIPVDMVTKDQRRSAKTANFGIIYGISAFGLSQKLDISNREAKNLIEQYFESYPSVAGYIGNVAENARRDGYVTTLFGRKRFLPDINSRNQVVRKLAERNAVNAPIQGTAADIIKLSMIRIDERLRKEEFKSRMVLQVHDELIFDTALDEVEELMAIVQEEMESVCRLSVPLTVDCNKGKNWLDAH